SAALTRLARAQGGTLFMVLLAGFAALLSRWTGQEDIAVGSTIANRNRAEIEGLIGFFVNSLVLRTDCAADPDFVQLLDRVRKLSLAAFAHQDLPFEKLVEEFAVERDPSRTPLFQVLFALQNASFTALSIPGLTFSPIETQGTTAKLDLTLSVAEAPEGLYASWEYNRDLFDTATVARMAGHLEVLLGGVLAAPDRRLSELPLLSTGELSQLLREWNDTEVPCPQLPLVHELFAAHAQRRPGAAALTWSGGCLTYGELDRRAGRLARHLRSLGVGPEVLVALCTERTSPERVVGIVAVLKAGGAYVSLDPAYPQERLAFLLADSRAPVVLTQERLAGLLPASPAAVIHLDGDPGAFGPEAEDALPDSGVAPDNLAYVVYTSGSTGRPKGVEIPHSGLMNLVRWHQTLYRVGPEDRGTQVASPAFDASIWELWPYLAAGASLHIPDDETRLSSSGMLRWWTQEGITLAYLMTPLAEGVLEEEIPPSLDLVVRALIIGGDRLRRGPRPEAGFRLMNHYGPAEYTVTSTVVEVPPEGERRGIPTIGRPIDNTRIHVLDRDFNPVPIGVLGELFVAGIGLARGYLGRPDLTAEKFVPDPFAGPEKPGARIYRTGDLVRYLPDGDIDFQGRLDHQVKLRGLRIELGEIEARLAQHPQVREATVLVREDRPGDRRLVAYWVPADEPPADDELRDFLRERLPAYMVPAAFIVLPALPLTPNGKVDRKALPAPERQSTEETWRAPRTQVEEILAGIWAELLGLERVGTADSFFELGGHSLLATQVMSRLRSAFDVEIPLRDVFEAPILSDFAARIETLRRTGAVPSAPPLVPAPRGGPLPLSFAQRRLWFIDQLEPGSPLYNIPVALRVEGPLHPGVLELCLGEIVRRHEALRTTFALIGDEPAQVIAPSRSVALPVIDLQAVPDPARTAELERLAREEGEIPFNLARGPLLRVTLLPLEPGASALLLTLHHVISDGWSMRVLIRDLVELYRTAGRPSPLPELPVQVADHAVWQRAWLRGDVLAAQLADWRRRLTGAPTVLELPTDRPRPAVTSQRGRRVYRLLPGALAERLRELGRHEGATLFMTLLAAFDVLLAQRSGRRDLLVGTPIAGRSHPEVEELIGCFVNLLPLRAEMSGDPSFRELLQQVRATTLEASLHQDLPFEALVDELGLERGLAHHPLVQVAFTFDEPRLETLEVPGMAVHPLRSEGGETRAQFDLTLNAWLREEGLGTSLTYSTDLFRPASAERLLDDFEVVLRQVAEQPALRLSELIDELTRVDRERRTASQEEMGSVRAEKFKRLRRRGVPAPSGEPTLAGTHAASGARQEAEHGE
ncbi:MAG TPA: amino acid adenylation domain-containing protein, partial [Thermoanaerobaculia bacterium]|nr:amino acid adenylation domain-containing protein [Thermoanaerobaculia bacterium]